MLRMPSYGGGSLSSASSGDQIQQRNLRRPQRLNLIQRILEQQQQQLQQQLQQQQQQQQVKFGHNAHVTLHLILSYFDKDTTVQSNLS